VFSLQVLLFIYTLNHFIGIEGAARSRLLESCHEKIKQSEASDVLMEDPSEDERTRVLMAKRAKRILIILEDDAV
jgi:hypothetical protein